MPQAVTHSQVTLAIEWHYSICSILKGLISTLRRTAPTVSESLLHFM